TELLGRADVRGLAVVVALRVVVEVPVDVLADVEVREPVAVQVGERGAGGPGDALVEAGLRGNVLELPAALSVGDIVEQGDAAPAGDEEVRPAVAVVVADCGPVRVEP